MISKLTKHFLEVKSAFVWLLLIGNPIAEKSGPLNSSFKTLGAVNKLKY